MNGFRSTEDHSLCSIRHRPSILIHTFDLQKTHPDTIMHQESWKKNTPQQPCRHTRRVSIEESALGETVSGIIVLYFSETVQPLWAREQGEAGISLPESPTEHKYNPLSWPFYGQGCVRRVETLLAFHHHHSFGFTICPQVTAVPYIKPWNHEREVPAQWTTPEIPTRRPLRFISFALLNTANI